MRRLTAALIVTSMTGLSFAAPSVYAKAQDGTWVEICTSRGIELVNLDDPAGDPPDAPRHLPSACHAICTMSDDDDTDGEAD